MVRTIQFISTVRKRCRVQATWQTALLLWLLCPASNAAAQSFFTDSGQVQFISRVPLHKFTGESDLLVGMINFADSTVDFYLDLTTLKTGIGKRDKDMRLSLDTRQFPFAEFIGKLTTPFEKDVEGPQAASVKGLFTVHGVSNPVEIDGTLQFEEGRIGLVAEWSINIEDYNITPTRLLIIKVDKIQQIKIEARLLPLEE